MNKKSALAAASLILATLLVFLVGTFAACDDEDFVVREDTTRRKQTAAENDKDKYRIYLITMDQGSTFWQVLDAGCQQAVRELNSVRYQWLAAADHTIEGQRSCLERAVNEGAQAILISAISRTELNEDLRRAMEAGVKIVYVDSAATEPATGTLMTDNEQAGRIAGRTMRRALAEAGITSGTIGVVALDGNALNISLRERGFRSTFEGTHFTVAPSIYMRETRESIRDDVRAHPDYAGFFGTNDQTTRIVSEQIRDSGTKQIVIGFDTSDFTLSMIQAGFIYATMKQQPQRMGHDGIMLAVRALKGESMEPNQVIDTGVSVITKEQL